MRVKTSIRNLPIRIYIKELVIDFYRFTKLKIYWKVFSKKHQNLATIVSDSEFLGYRETLSSINSSNEARGKFRQNPELRKILEHLNYRQAISYCERISEITQVSPALVNAARKNDSFGSPVTYYMPQWGRVSATTLRYVATFLEIGEVIDLTQIQKIIEIGVGYGGQSAIFQSLCEEKIDYALFDIPEALELTKKYLKEIQLDRNVQFISDVNEIEGEWDLVLSNYAFSELPMNLQRDLSERVLKHSHHGYMIMNSGLHENTSRGQGKLSAKEVMGYIPNAKIADEKPLTGPDNYVIYW